MTPSRGQGRLQHAKDRRLGELTQNQAGEPVWDPATGIAGVLAGRAVSGRRDWQF
jgi:hypothetical protein